MTPFQDILLTQGMSLLKRLSQEFLEPLLILPQHLHSHSLPPGHLLDSIMLLRSITHLSLGSRSIDLPSPGMRIRIISHPMTDLSPDVLSPICSS
jgi:hypothetical protein